MARALCLKQKPSSWHNKQTLVILMIILIAKSTPNCNLKSISKVWGAWRWGNEGSEPKAGLMLWKLRTWCCKRRVQSCLESSWENGEDNKICFWTPPSPLTHVWLALNVGPRETSNISKISLTMFCLARLCAVLSNKYLVFTHRRANTQKHTLIHTRVKQTHTHTLTNAHVRTYSNAHTVTPVFHKR